ncbi:MAG: META domain-containing protein [Alistipes sp.]|nr:META domain-containing protein [Alistipes sp.]
MKKSIFAALVCAMFLVVGCCACRSAQKNAKPLKGTEWHLVQLGGTEMELAADTFTIVIAEDNSLAGIAACNHLLGQVVLAENQAISFGQVGSTMMLCPENDELEAKFIAMLGGITHYDIDADKLILMQDGVIKAILKAVPAAVEAK